MKIDWSWPAAVVFTVVFGAISGLVWSGKLPAESVGFLLTWLIPSPMQLPKKEP